MKIAVLIKEVPELDKVTFDREKGVINRSSAKGEMNPFDENALQAAIDLKNEYGGKVYVITMGLPKAESLLRDAYARGADEMILVTDKAFGGSDTLATSRTLAAVIEKNGFDIILCGEKSVDGDTAQVGAEVAEILEIPHSYYVEKIMFDGKNSITAHIENICGETQVREIKLPVLLGVTKSIAKLKFSTVTRKLESYGKMVQRVSLEELELLKKEAVGFSGSPTKVVAIKVPKEIEKGNKLFKEDVNAFTEAVCNQFTEKGLI